MSTSSKIIKNTSWVIIAKVAYRVANSVIAIIISRILGVSASGIYNIGLTYFTIGLSIALWGFDQIIVRETSKDRSKIKGYFNNLLFFQTLLSLIVVIVFLLVSIFVPYPRETQLIIRIFSLSILSESVITICQSVLFVLEDIKKISIVNFMLSILKVGMLYVFVKKGLELINVIWVFTIISFLSLIVHLILTKEYLPKKGFKLDFNFCFKALHDTLFIFLISILFTFDSRIDVLTLSFISNDFNIGLYTAAFSIISFFYLLPQAFRDAIFPYLSKYHNSSKEKTQKIYFFSIKYILLLTIPLAAGVSILSNEVINIVFAQKFYNSNILLKVGIWTFPLYSIMLLNSRLLVIDYKSKYVSKCLLISSISIVISNLFFYPLFGIIASTIIRVLAVLLLTSAIVRKVSKELYKINVKLNFIKILGSTIIMSLAVYALKEFSVVLSIIVGIIIYFLLNLILRTFDIEDYNYWKLVIKSKKESS